MWILMNKNLFSCVFHNWKGAPWSGPLVHYLFFVERWSREVLAWYSNCTSPQTGADQAGCSDRLLAVLQLLLLIGVIPCRPMERGWVQQSPGHVVGRKPKCGTLKERAGLLLRAPGRSQQVWPLLLSALPSQLQCSHISRASLYSWAAQASRRMQEAEVQPSFLCWCAASLTLTKNLGWQGNILLEYQNKISYSSDMENIRCLAFYSAFMYKLGVFSAVLACGYIDPHCQYQVMKKQEGQLFI